MGSDVNTVRETSSARAMGVAIASGDRRGFFLPVRSQWDEREKMARVVVSVGVMRAVDVPKRAREVFWTCARRFVVGSD